MRNMAAILSVVGCMLLGPVSAVAQEMPMTFFITSDGSGNGANLGGLAGADALCQRLAA